MDSPADERLAAARADPLGGARLRRDRQPRAGGIGAPRARVALTLALALALAVSAAAAAQSEAGRRIDALLTELEEGAERAPRLAEIERWHGELARALERDGKLEWPDTQALCWAAFELADPRPGDPEPRPDALGLLEGARRAVLPHGARELRADAECYLAYERRKRGLVAAAREDLERAVAELTSTRRFRPFLYLELSECARIEGDWTAALDAIGECERVHAITRADRPAAENGEIDVKIPLLRCLCHVDLGVPDHAFVELAKAREAARDGVDPAVARALEIASMRVAELTEDWNGALAILDAREARGDADAPLEAARLARSRAFVLSHLARGDPARLAQVASLYERALAEPSLYEYERTTDELHLADVELQRGRRESARDLLAAARARMEAASRASSAGRAPHDAALLAALCVRLALESGAPRPEVESALAELERTFARFLEDWDSVPARRDGTGFLRHDDRRAILVELVRATLAVDPDTGAERALALLLRAQALGSLSSALGGTAPSLEETRRALCGERRGALVYLPGPLRSYAIAFGASAARAFELAARDDWYDLRDEWVAAIAVSPASAGDRTARAGDIARLGEALARALLPPEIEVWLSELDEVSIAGLDLTGYVPFEALPCGGGTLGDRLAIAYAPSLVVAAKLARRDPAEPAPCALRVVAAPSAHESTSEPLEWHSPRERALERAYGRGALELRLRDDATLAAVRGDGTADCTVLEITAHGFYDAQRSPPAGFALAPGDAHDGRVACTDLDGATVSPLVLLAVCGAARGPQREGDDGIGDFSGTLLKAGAQCVALSPVDLEQSATEELLDRFHAELARGAPPARAMLEARRALAGGERADPYYRCLLHVVGLGHRPLFPPRPTASPRAGSGELLAVGAAAATLAAAAVALARRRARARTAPERDGG